MIDVMPWSPVLRQPSSYCVSGSTPVVDTSRAVAERLSAQAPGTLSPGCWVDYAGARPTVRVAGRVDRVTINEVSGVIRGLRAVGIRHLVIDMSATLDCDPRLLTVLARAHSQLADDAGRLRITGVKLPQFLDALRAATLEEAFVVYDAVRRETPPPISGPRPPNSPARTLDHTR